MFRKATADEQKAYSGVYPVHYYVGVDGRELPVEYLGFDWSKENPQYEVIAPEGFHFAIEETHTMLCFTVAEAKSRTKSIRLESCAGVCQ